MNSSPDTTRYQTFLFLWEDQCNHARKVVDFLHKQPELLEKFKTPILSANELEQAQQDWLSLLAQFTTPPEKDFFKEHWVPISKGIYEYFIDLSAPNMPVFCLFEFPFGALQWGCYSIFHSSKGLLQSATDFDWRLTIAEESYRLDASPLDMWRTLGPEIDKLGLKGFLGYNAIGSYWYGDAREASYGNIENGRITLHNVNAGVLTILPGDLNIELYEIEGNLPAVLESAEMIESVKGLLYLVDLAGVGPIHSFYFLINDSPDSYARYEQGTFVLVHTDDLLLINAFARFQKTCSEPVF